MKYSLGARVYAGKLTRRDFLWLLTASTAGIVTGCATNPVTGERQLMLVSEQQELGIDRQNSPHQFSSDYGPVQDQELNAYIERVGKALSLNSHRPDMPYSFRVVNATYVNAYAFPGGSIAATVITPPLERPAESSCGVATLVMPARARPAPSASTGATLPDAMAARVAMTITAARTTG